MALLYLALAMASFALSPAGSTISPPYFVVVAPDKVRPYSEYEAAVTLIGTDKPVAVTVGLKGTENNPEFSLTTVVTIEPNTTQLAKLSLKDLKPDDYNLTVRGDSNFEFENTTSVRFVEKYQTIFIQTDRATYKPGHKVQFRVLVLDIHLKPNQHNPIDIVLKDGQKNRVKEWKAVTAPKGVYSNEIQLSSYPVLGDWTIEVKNNGNEKTKTFTVAEYVLPKFEVTVDVPKHATFADSKVPVTVSAKYTYGQPVKGEATISIKPEYSYYQDKTLDNSKTIKVDTVGQTEIDLVQTLGLESQDFYSRNIIFNVAFKEDLTDKVLNGSGMLTLHKGDCKLEFKKVSDYLIPGKPYKTLLKISNWDDTPYTKNLDEPIKVRASREWSNNANNEWQNYTLPANGILELSFDTNENTTFLHIEATFRNTSAYDSASTRTVFTPDNTTKTLELRTINENLKIGDTLEMEVSTQEGVKEFFYYLLGRNELLESKYIKFEEGQLKIVLKIPVIPAMAPNAQFLATYILPSGEVVAASKHVSVEGVMSNYVTLSASPNETEPGQNAVISVQSKPNSYVGLMGVDQSVLLLKKGNDISKTDVETEISSFDNTWIGGKQPWKRSFRGWYPGSINSPVLQEFKNAGTVVLTNANIPQSPFIIRPGPVLFGSPGIASQAGVQFAMNSPPMVYKDKVEIVKDQAPVVVRQKFPETWIWNTIESGPDGKSSLFKPVPDTITSWIITGFSINAEDGLGLSEDPAKVTVFRPFFISLNLPYSVTRGESISIPVNVFNYMNKEVKAEVTLKNPGWFTFLNSTKTEGGKTKREAESSRSKVITIAPNSAGTASFVVKPTKLGYMPVEVIAKSPLAGDGVSQKLRVKPEGETQYRTKGIFVDLRDKPEYVEEVKLSIPQSIVPESENIEVSAVGDLLGAALQNLDSLIRQPYGCGEQNMLNFVPNIVILDYLTNSKMLTDTIKQKAIKYLEMGYQRELTYKHKDNSYSAFGESDKSGSTWLTAFVAKSFKQAQKYIDIESSSIIDPLRWLASQQSENGSFSEVGHVSHKSMQGGASEGLALTAYALTAFAESADLTDEFAKTTEKAAKYVADQIEKNSVDVYSLAVAAYALNLLGHPAKDKASELLEAKAKAEGELKWWEKEKTEEDAKELNPWDSVPNAINVEMTSYALLSYLNNNQTSVSLSILKWLLSQQNSEGGFASTQDTVVALGAIAKFAKSMGSGAKDISITFEYEPEGSTKLDVNDGNALVLQKAELPNHKIRTVKITAKGKGFAVVQVSYRYNVDKKGAFPLFDLEPKVESTSKNHLLLSVCTSYKGRKASNMAVMEVTLPSGYTIDDDGIKALKVTARVKRVETKNENTVVILYFDKVTSEKLCPAVSAYRTFKVAEQRPVPIIIYDYYDNSQRATEFYTPPPTSLCDICEGSDCENCDNKV